MAEVLAVCVSEVRGVQKRPAEEIELRDGYGVVGDAHAGAWHRQVSLLSQESVDALQGKLSLRLRPGDFAENILVKGIRVHELPVGTRLRIGAALCEVTQIGKECHRDCAIRRTAGDCVMPREGVFVRVLLGGRVRPGDAVGIEEEK